MQSTLRDERPVRSNTSDDGVHWGPLGGLVVGDFVSFVAFAAIGLQSHQHHAQLGEVLVTAVPFALGWYLVSPFAGAFRRRLFARPMHMVARTAIAWICAWPVALLFRWALASDHFMNLSFALVILLVNLVLLCGWRLVLAAVVRVIQSRQA